ncbi:hypothetical protein NL676_033442 [Syzygium grande]|nr:hypothetical protein NL676_033442 [Syzygium grande]
MKCLHLRRVSRVVARARVQKGRRPRIEMSQPKGRSQSGGASAAVKKGKVYGLGSLARDSMKSVGTSSARTSSRRSKQERVSWKKKWKTSRIYLREKGEKMKKMEERLDAIDAGDEAMRIMQQQLSMLMRQQRWSRFAKKTMRMKQSPADLDFHRTPPDEDHEE